MLAPLAEEKEESIDEGHEGEEQEEADVLHQAMLLAGWPGLRQAVPRVSNLSHPAAGRAARLGHRGARVRQVTSPPHVSGCHYFASQPPLPFSNSFFWSPLATPVSPLGAIPLREDYSWQGMRTLDTATTDTAPGDAHPTPAPGATSSCHVHVHVDGPRHRLHKQHS